jgi:dipeptidyl-peptidase-4
MKKTFLFLFLFLAASCAFCQSTTIDLQGVFTGKYRYDRVRSLSWRPQTLQYTYYDSENSAIKVVDLKNGKESVLLTYDQICEFAMDKKGATKADFSSAGGRISTAWQWKDKDHLAIYAILPNEKEGYINCDVAAKKFSFLPDPTSGIEVVDQDANNALYIYTREKANGFYVNDMRNPSSAQIILCPDTAKDVVFGEPVHRSEWGIEEGWYFSPNSNYIAFYRMDQSMVEDYPLLQTSEGEGASHIAYFKNIKYPMAGRTSHQVKVGIFDARKSFQQKKCDYHYIQTDPADGEFLTNVTFSPDEKYLYITHLNREQNHSKLIRYDVATGKKLAVLIEEQDARYVEPLHRILFLKNGNFIYQSDRDGWNHFYLYTFDGKLVKQITKGNWPVISDFGLDASEQNILFMTNKDCPVDQYLYSVNIASGKLTNLTPKSGTHTIMMSDDKSCFFDYFSNLHTPMEIYAGSTDGKYQRLIQTVKNPYGDVELGRDTIFSLKNSHGDDLYCEMIFPPHFNKNEQYPCLVYVYGGPHSQLVTNTFMTAGVFLNYMAQKGYVIFVLDNRGTSNRGAEFEKCIHRQLGVLESEDQMVGINYLHSLPFIDKKRMGIDGWSFGGFMTLTMVTEHPDIFASATCGGPVVNWEWYEIMYGERYMDTPQENPDGYEHANIINKIYKLKCPLLIMHGQQDNTVVQQHSLELLHQSVLDDVQINYFPYTTHEHNVMGSNRVQMWHKIEQFHGQYLLK